MLNKAFLNEMSYAGRLSEVLLYGQERPDRTGTGTIGSFAVPMSFDLRHGFPILQGKKIFWKSVLTEFLWFLRAEPNNDFLREHDVHIWDAWADENGLLGRIYGVQWRKWRKPNGETVDQLRNALNTLRTNPYDRRILVSAWNPGELEEMALPPCHILFQFYATPDGYLDLFMYQRSADMFLGVPFDIASYAIMLELFARLTQRKARFLNTTYGDTHIYKNHVEQVKEYLDRIPKLPDSAPMLLIAARADLDLDNLTHDDFELVDYNPMPAIKAPISV